MTPPLRQSESVQKAQKEAARRRLYYFCLRRDRWQVGRCWHWRCKRASYFPPGPDVLL